MIKNKNKKKELVIIKKECVVCLVTSEKPPTDFAIKKGTCKCSESHSKRKQRCKTIKFQNNKSYLGERERERDLKDEVNTKEMRETEEF